MTTVPSLPIPVVLTIEAGDRPGYLWVEVRCPVCWRCHRHRVLGAVREFTAIPPCLDQVLEPIPYTVVLDPYRGAA